MSDLSEALAKLSLKDGDIVFVDASAVSTQAIETLCVSEDSPVPAVVFVFACCRHGQSVEDAVFSMSRAELDMLLKEKSNEDEG